MITKKRFNSLAKIHQPHCISIYIPTDGPRTSDKDQIRFKNKIHEAKQQLQGYNLQEKKIDEYLQPARELLDDSNFWRGLREGLAVFLYQGKMEFEICLHPVKPSLHIMDHLYLLPLATLLERNQPFYLLVVSTQMVKFFQGDNANMKEIDMEDVLPQQLVDSVGKEYEQKSLQFRSGISKSGDTTIYHGHGSGNETEKKTELKQFFLDISKGLQEYINEQRYPLIVACVEYYFPIFKEACNYDQLVDDPIAGNHEHTDENELRSKALEKISGKWEEELQKDREKYHQLLSYHAASYEAPEVVKAAYHGQVEVLFVDESKELWGYFTPLSDELEVHEHDNHSNVDLNNLAAIHTVMNQGRIHLLDPTDMPSENQPLNAIFRYAI